MASEGGNTQYRRGLKRRRLLQLALAWLVTGPEAKADGYSVAQIEAALVFQIAGFVRWPHDFGGIFRLGVLGDSDREGPLRRLAQKHQLHGAEVQVHRLSRAGPWREVDMIYVAPGEAELTSRVARSLASHAVLLVTHAPGAARRGAAINFYEEHGKSRFEINPDNLKRHRLRASYKLLSLARIVRNA